MRYIELAERSYREVLDATKHQDDKVGRFLTAIAFLTTGAISLIATDDGLKQQFDLPGGSSHPLLAWATGAFFLCTLCSVALLLLCLSVPVRLPQSKRDPMNNSHIFYSYAAAKPVNDWMDSWRAQKAEGTLEEAIADDYVREAHNLAERVNSKYRHSFEASWLFVLALLFLGSAVFLKIEALFSQSNGEIQFEGRQIFEFSLIVFVFVSLQVYTRAVHDVRSMQKVVDYVNRGMNTETGPSSGQSPSEGGAGRAKSPKEQQDAEGADEKRAERRQKQLERNVAAYEQRRWTGLLVIAAAIYTLALGVPWPDSACVASAVIAVAAAAVTGIVWLTRSRWDEGPGEYGEPLPTNDRRAWGPAVLSGVATVVAIAVGLYFDGLFRVAAILAPAVVLSAFNIARPALAQLKARKFETEENEKSLQTSARHKR